jgi:hypothetical protein
MFSSTWYVYNVLLWNSLTSCVTVSRSFRATIKSAEFWAHYPLTGMLKAGDKYLQIVELNKAISLYPFCEVSETQAAKIRSLVNKPQELLSTSIETVFDRQNERNASRFAVRRRCCAMLLLTRERLPRGNKTSR